MRSFVVTFILALALVASAATAARQYFSRVRQVRVAAPDRQNYVLVDEDIWTHSRRDLGDLRLYAGEAEVPYAMTVQAGGQPVQPAEAKLLNVGRVQGRTQFVVDMSGLPEYNEIRLRLAESTRDFVVRARVEGLDNLSQPSGVDLGSSTLFDFSRESLGRNSTLKLSHPARFQYLRVVVPGIAPEEVMGATVADTRKRAAAWMPIAISPAIQQDGHATVITWTASQQVPLARVVFSVDPQQVNFRRRVSLDQGEGNTVSVGELTRIHLSRGGNDVDSECLELVFPEVYSGKFKVQIENGDDPPLSITQVKAFARERRLYFDPKGNSALALYYGDSPLNAPVYDYGKVFRVDERAAVATLGPEAANPAYQARPDERPWTEQHPALLWVTLVVAILALGGLALKQLAGTRSR